MNTFIAQYASSLLVASFICGVAISVSGKKEIVRLCGACILVIIVLSPTQSISFSLKHSFEAADDTENYVNEVLEQSQNQHYSGVATTLSDHIRQKALELDIYCMPSVQWHISPEGHFITDGVIISSISGAVDKMEQLFDFIESECAIARENIIVEEY